MPPLWDAPPRFNSWGALPLSPCDLPSPTQTVFGLVYVNPVCLTEFHTAVNRDPAAIIPAWDGSTGTRTLSFMKSVDAPAFIKRVLGSGTLRVVESQSVALGPVQGSVSLASVPCPEMKGADKFKTAVAVDLVPTPCGCQVWAVQCMWRFSQRGFMGSFQVPWVRFLQSHHGLTLPPPHAVSMHQRLPCAGSSCQPSQPALSLQVHARVSCSAAGPYGLSGAIEGFMAETAKASLVEFFEFCARFLAASGAERLLAGASEARALLEGLAAPSPAQLPRADSEAWADAEALPLPAADSDSTEVLYLRYLCSTGDQAVALLQRMDGRLARLQRDPRPAIPARDLVLGFAAGVVTASALGALALSWRRQSR